MRKNVKGSLFRKLNFAVLIGLLLTGCMKEDTRLPMEAPPGQYMPADCSIATRGDAFAADLCVVAESQDKGGNAALTAASSLIFDITNQEALYADNIFEKLYPASVTKILTALVALEACEDLSETVTFSYKASHITEWGAKKCGFQEGDQISMKDLLYSFLIYSGNDAGIAIAEHIAGSEEEFAKLMNEKAKSLGAWDSHFVNSHGLHSDDHYTTAYDIYLIFNECIQKEQFVDIIGRTSYTAKYRTASGEKKKAVFENTNRYLLGKEEAPDGTAVIGGKTGTTSKAGSCLALYSIDEEERQYISIVLKAETSDSLFQQMTELLRYEHRNEKK